MKTSAAAHKLAFADQALEQAQSTIYLMGFSFVLGSLFTILLLLLLEFMRRNKVND